MTARGWTVHETPQRDERHCEKEPQGGDRAVDARRLHAALRLVQLEKTLVFRCRRVGRPADKGGECSDVSPVGS